MLAQTEAPGVYYQHLDASLPRVNPLRTDVAGFVGIARRGPLHVAVPVLSWRQFVAWFGDFTGAGYLAYAVRAFFENGGRKCWVVRVAAETAATADWRLPGLQTPRRDYWRVAASSPGVWGNDLTIALKETHRAQTRTVAAFAAPEYSVVASVSGFVRGTHVQLRQGAVTARRVVAEVDATTQRLYWQHPLPEARLPYDAPLSGFELSQPLLLESIEYTLVLREAGRLLRVYEGLSLVSEHPRYGPRVLARRELLRGGSAPMGQPAELAAVKVDFDGGGDELPVAPERLLIEEWRGGDPADSSWWADAQAWKRQWAADGLPPLAVWDAATATAQALEGEQHFSLAGGADGLAQLRAEDFIGEAFDPQESDEAQRRKRRGLRVLEEEQEVALLAVPDIHIQPQAETQFAPPAPCIPDPCLPNAAAPAPSRPRAVGDLPPLFSEADIFRVQLAQVEQCEKLRDRFALLAPPAAATQEGALGTSAVRAWRKRFETQFAALYYPWLAVVDPLRLGGALTRVLPACGHVAGQFAQTDADVGTHKAPANAPLAWAQDVTALTTEAAHGVLNAEHINVIRALAGRGLRIFGALSLSSDSDWRFISVRRLMMMIEKAIASVLQWAVFEPNDLLTRAKLQLSLTSFFLTLWQQGALAGATPEASFFVKCDEENNPPSTRTLGHLLIEIGVAPVQPFEFILLRVGRVNNEFEINEAGTLDLKRGGR